MEYKNIKELMEKYWTGETDLQEESTLKTYFAGADVHPSLEQFRALFTYYETSRQDKSLDNIDTAVLEHIQGKAAPKEAKVKSLTRVLSIAAAILVLVGTVTVFWNTNTASTETGAQTITFDSNDPEEAKLALAEVKAALALVSNKVNEGKQEAIKGLYKTKAIPTLKR
jgi:hypothetical protein